MPRLTIVNVSLRDREDGGTEVLSDDLPGLILSGPDRDKVTDAVTPAIEALLLHRGFKVIVRQTVPLAEILQSARLLRDQHIQFHHQQFVVEFPDVAE